MDFIGEAIDKLKDGITDGLTDFVFGILFFFFYQPLNFFAMVMDHVLINPSNIQSAFLTSTSVLINSMISGIAICILIYKMLEVMKLNAEGQAESPGYYVAKLVPMFMALILLPWLIDIMINISFTITRTLLDLGNSDYLDTINEWKSLKEGTKNFNEKLKGIEIVQTGPVMFLLFILMLTVFFAVFIFQFVQRIADLIIMKLLAPLVAISMLADENNYLSVWWRELLAITIQLPLQVMSFYMGINMVFGATLDIPQFLLGIGFFILTVKSPSFIRSMVYSTGSGRMATSAAGSGAKMLLRSIIMKK